MSKGPGRIQTTILKLIADNPDKAWTIEDICCEIYEVRWVEKKHRVAVLRALRTMRLPGTWRVELYGYSHRKFILYDTCNDAIMIERYRLNLGYSEKRFRENPEKEFDSFKPILEDTARNRRYRDGSALDRIDVERVKDRQASRQKTMGLMRICGTLSKEAMTEETNIMTALKAEQESLEAERERLSVS